MRGQDRGVKGLGLRDRVSVGARVLVWGYGSRVKRWALGVRDEGLGTRDREFALGLKVGGEGR